jgi:cell division protein FtsQ
MAGKRKRIKRRLRAQPVLFLLLLISLYVGITRSPLTAVRHVRVEGAQAFDEARINGEIQKLVGIPCLQINPRETEARILALPEVRSATLTRSIFGNAVLLVDYRMPVARLATGDELALSDDGVVCPIHEMPPDLPTLYVPAQAKGPVLTVSGIWEPQSIAKLAVLVRNLDLADKESINLDDSGRVKLHIGSGSVELGNCDKIDQKIHVLKDRLSRNPDELMQVAELDLTVPERPAFTPKSSRVTKKEQDL